MKKINKFKNDFVDDNPTIDVSMFPFCPNNCVFCTNRPARIKEQPLDKMIDFLEKAAKSGKTHLELSAMEPTFYKDLPIIINKAKEFGFTLIHLITNGQKISDKKFLRNLVDRGVNKITVSLHSHREDLENKITNNPTNFKNKVQGVKNIVELQKKKKLDLYINTVINNYNYQYLPEIARFLSDLGIKYNNIYFPHILGNALKNFDKVVPCYEDLKNYLEDAQSIAKEVGMNLAIMNVPFCILKDVNHRDYFKDYFSSTIEDKKVKKEKFTRIDYEGKIKGKKCKQCAHFNICDGVSKDYIKFRGWGEFKPVFGQPLIDDAAQKRHWARLTKVCNQNCLFCLDKESQDGTILSIKEIEKDLQKGYKDGARRVILSGGEATVHPDFLKIARLARNIGYDHIQVISNGLKLSDPDFFDEAIKAGIDEMTFSIHGHNSELHDKLVGVKGAFIKAIKALKNTKKYPNLIVSIDICINGLNYKYLPEMIKMFIDSGFYEFDLLHIIPFGTAWKNKNLMFFDAEKALPYLHKAFEFSKDKKVHIWTNRLPAQYLEGYEDLIQDPVKIADEVAGRVEMFEDFFKKNKEFYCKGERCQYCFLEKFCSDLRKLKIDKKLDYENWPQCISKADSLKRDSSIVLKDIFDGKEVIMKKFTNFFIKERYFVKSLSCKKCKEYKNCSGAPIKIIKEKGFKILNKNR